MTYKEYLKTTEWAVLRRIKLQEANHRCQVCNGDGELHVHHRTYERIRMELLTDLIVLCADCHRLFHFRDQPEPDALMDDSIYFITKSGQKKRIRRKDIDTWQEAFKHIDVERELRRISETKGYSSFFTDKSWYFKLASILHKMNNKYCDPLDDVNLL
jgi:hypothetical protein